MDIIEKLKNLNDENDWKSWSLHEKKQLLKIYFIISKKERYIFDLIFRNHECDSWEDIFRDYDVGYLADKAEGVKIALDNIEEFHQKYEAPFE